MTRFTKEARQQIVEDYAKRHGGVYDPAGFEAEVRKKGEKHPAFAWFEWNDSEAARQHRIWQAREFVQGLTIRFEVREVHRGKMRISERSAPLVLSPADGRRAGGGYVVTDPSSSEHMAELRRQAAVALRSFASRYEAALADAGVTTGPIDRIVSALEAGMETREAA